MTFLDYLVIACYAVAMLAIGRYYARRTVTADDYLLGGRTMSPFMIGVSLFATLMSTLTYLALPGEIIGYGPLYFSDVLAYPLIFVIVGWGLIPWIMNQHATSGYELLERRLGLSGRVLGSAMFVSLRVVWMASILFATSDKVLLPLLKLEQHWMPVLSLLMGVITVIYTMEGGLRAVVMTDALQSLVMLLGALAMVIVVTVQLGGVGAWWPTEWLEHWQQPVIWPDPAVRVTVVGSILNMTIWMVCTSGSDQMAIQRYLATRDVKAAQRSYGVLLLSQVVVMALLVLAGLAVLGYYTRFPEELPAGVSFTKQADKLMPQFVVTALPAGLTGLVIAAILSAAMSSLSSGMNSTSAVITTDFIGRFRRTALSETQRVRLARWLSLVVAVVAILLSTVVSRIEGNLLELCTKVVNLLTAPLFVLFFLALFVPWSSPLGAVAATVASVGVAVDIAFTKRLFELTMLWIAPCSLLAGIGVGTLVSLIPIGHTSNEVQP